jgi:RNA polymerase sigma factor (sigma-70 family)
VNPSDPEATASQAPQPTLFATTHWSVVVAAVQEDPLQAGEALEALCGTYWYPLYAYARRTGLDEETAKDLTQGFFERLLEGHYLKHVDRRKGRFRSFLLASLKHFLANERDRQQAVRRGGRCHFISLDEAWIQICQGEDAALALGPEQLYERRWALAVLESVKRRLAANYAASGRARLYDTLEVYLSGESGQAPYAEVADRLGLSLDTVKKNVERLRRRYGELLREEIAHTVSHPAEIDDELRHLRQVLSQ